MHSALPYPSVSGVNWPPVPGPKPGNPSIASVVWRNRGMFRNVQSEVRPIMKIVSFPRYNGCDFKILGGGRRGRCPLEPSGGPGIAASHLPVERSPSEVNHGQEIADGKNGGTGGRHHVVDLKFRRIHVVAAGHAEIAEQELREKSEVESDEEDKRSDACQPLRVHAPGDFGPPEMQTTEIPHHGSADHDVVEVGNDEVGVVDVHVNAKAAEE